MDIGADGRIQRPGVLIQRIPEDLSDLFASIGEVGSRAEFMEPDYNYEKLIRDEVYDFYLRNLIHSGLVLDDKMFDIIHFTAMYFGEQIPLGNYTTGQWWGLFPIAASAGFATTAYCLAPRFRVILCPLVACGVLYTYCWWNNKIVSRDLSNISEMLQSFQNLIYVHKKIHKYLEEKERHNESLTVPDYIGNLYLTVSYAVVPVFDAFMRNCEKLMIVVPSIRKEYWAIQQLILKHMEYDFSQDCQGSLLNLVKRHKKLVELSVYLTSIVLSYIARSMFPILTNNYPPIFVKEMVTIEIFPDLKVVVDTCYNEIKKKFEDVKCYHIRLSHLTVGKNTTAAQTRVSRITAKTADTIYSLNNLVDKSRQLLDILQGQVDLNPREMAPKLSELHLGVVEYGHELQILCKTLELEAGSSSTVSKSQVQISEVIEPLEESISSLSPSPSKEEETSDDEIFEIFLKEEPKSSGSMISKGALEEPSSLDARIALLQSELKLALSQNAKFNRAAKKRGFTVIPAQDSSSSETAAEKLKIQREEASSSDVFGSCSSLESQSVGSLQVHYSSHPPPPPMMPVSSPQAIVEELAAGDQVSLMDQIRETSKTFKREEEEFQ